MDLPGVVAIDGVPRDYAWGSTSAIQQLLGVEPDGRPLAELWFGAHPSAPSPVPALGTKLDELIGADPSAALGGPLAQRFGGRLPFLVKLLAAERPLSIQVHPTRAQAEAGFAAEDARGVALDAPNRNYRDRNHKPELLCALSEFEALCGFRPVHATIEIIDALPGDAGAALRDVRADLTVAEPSAGLRAAFARLLRLDAAAGAELVERVVAGCRPLAGRHAPAQAHGGGVAAAARVVDTCARAFPGDIGAVLSLLLNPVVLRPGEAVYLGAGTVHAYLHGTGVEVMANSDNVLRCGLTAKHVDVAELLAITDFTELPEPRWPDDGAAGFGVGFDVPVPDFALHSVDLDACRLPGRSEGSCATGTAGQPYLVLCASGGVRVRAGQTSVVLPPGHAAFVPARDPAFTLGGTGQTFLATVQEENPTPACRFPS